MASLTIRKLPDAVKQRLRERAAKHGRSTEEEARQLISAAVSVEAGAAPSVQEERQPFDHGRAEGGGALEDDDWVSELIRIANGAGEGVFDEEPQPLREFDL